jgi:lipopolysaccharide export system protein LptC
MPMEIKALLLFLVVFIIYYKLKENNKTEIEECRQEQLHQSFMKEKNENIRTNKRAK